MLNILQILLVSSIFTEINCGVLQDDLPSYAYAIDGHYQILFLFASISVVAVVRYYIRAFRFLIPYTFFALTIGIFGGVIVLHLAATTEALRVSEVAGEALMKCYLVLILFKTAFCIDVYAFFRSLPQILVISVPGSFLTACFCGLLMKVLIDPEWSVVDGIFFGIILTPIYPIETMRIHELSSSPHLRHIVTLLEGETLVSAAFIIYIYLMLRGHMSGFIVYWYHFVMGIALIFLGLPLGYLCGLFGSILMRMSYNQTITLVTLTVAMAFGSYFLVHEMVHSGILATICTGLLMNIEKTTLPAAIGERVDNMWQLISVVATATLYLVMGFVTPMILQSGLKLHDILLVFISYLFSNVGRLIAYLMCFPILKRLGYGMTFRQLIFCVWIGLKNPLVLTLLIPLLDIQRETRGRAVIFYLHTVSVCLLFLLINNTLLPVILKTLSLLKISVPQEVTMSNSMKFIGQARERAITILKMDKFLSDANWPLVLNSTILRHPYRSKVKRDYQTEEREEEAFLMGHRFAICPDCKKNLSPEPTPTELKDMTREAKMRVLKLKKICYSRLYEDGMISNDGLRNLHQAVHIAMDSEEALIKLDGLRKLFNKEGFFYRCVKNCFIFFFQLDNNIQPPRKHWRLVCYRIVNLRSYKIFTHAVLFFNIGITVYESVSIGFPVYSTEYYILFECNVAIFLVLFTDFWLKIFSYSWIYIWKDGFKRYFRSIWNVTDFIVLNVVLVDVMLYIAVLIQPSLDETAIIRYVNTTILTLRLFTVLRFLQFITLCQKGVYQKIVKYLDQKIDAHRAMAYELCKNYLTAEEEILEHLNYIIDNERIREVLRPIFEKDRLNLTKTLGVAQKDRPKMTIFVKTKLAMRTVLNSMMDDVHELKASGWVDALEYAVLLESLTEQRRLLKSIKFVQPPSPKLIFQEIAWMGDDEKIIQFLYENAVTRKFEEGEVVCENGKVAEGIYVLITGLLKVHYEPKSDVLELLNESGTLPIVDYICSTNYDETLADYIVTGNCIGELSTLTQRSYNCTVSAKSYSQVFILRHDVLKQAMEMDSDPVTGLETRIWKIVSLRIAIPLLMNVPAYRTSTKEKIKFTLESSFMPNLTNYKVFVVNGMMQDVLLIEGRAIDFNTRRTYIAPCCIPRCVQRLILPRSSFFGMSVKIETRLLIIPAKGFNEYEIMIEEERVCELVAKVSSKCLQHLAEKKLAKKWKPRESEERTSKSKVTVFGSANRVGPLDKSNRIEKSTTEV